MEAVLGLQELREQLKKVDPKDQILHIDVAGRDPEEALTHIPYEKGALFLKTLGDSLRPRPFRHLLARLFRPFRLPEHHDR